MPSRSTLRDPAATRQKLVEAAVRLMRDRGFHGTSVEEICGEAGVTKGSFFHHFESKEAIGRAAVAAWGVFGAGLYAAAWREPATPLEEVHRLFDIMIGFTEREEPCVCLVGMMTQEMAGAAPGLREACGRELDVWTEMMSSRLAAAKAQLVPEADFDPAEVAWYLNSLWQGSMLVGKARPSAGLIRRNLELAREWVDSLFSDTPRPPTR